MQTTITRSIGIEEWCQLSKEGIAPPVTIPLEGSSMRPLIRRGIDPVTIVPLQRPLKKGDVILFTTTHGRFVVHRVWKLKDGYVCPLGDNCWNPDGWFPEENVLGQGVCYIRNGRRYRLDTRSARIWGRIWMCLFPVRKVYYLTRALAGKCYRKFFKRRGADHG